MTSMWIIAVLEFEDFVIFEMCFLYDTHLGLQVFQIIQNDSSLIGDGKHYSVAPLEDVPSYIGIGRSLVVM